MKVISVLVAMTFAMPLWSVAQVKPFRPQEALTYEVSYYLMGMWVSAGEVTFSVNDTVFRGKPSYVFKGVGQTYKRYDWFFPVRDTYLSIADSNSFKPYFFQRDVSEGSFYMRESNIYDYRNEQVITVSKIKEHDLRIDTIDLKPSSFDVLSMIYHVRGLDFASFQAGQIIPVRMVIDRETYDLTIRYLGRETYAHPTFGTIPCHVFSPQLVEGTIFSEGEGMKVWVTADANVVPVYIESEIRVGEIRTQLIRHEGLGRPFGAM